MRIQNRLMLVAIALLTAGCGGSVSSQIQPPAVQSAPPPATVEALFSTEPVQRGDIQQTVNVRGRVVGAQEEHLFFHISGQLEHFYVKQGDAVQKGDLLVALETGQLGAQLAQARLKVKMAEIDLAEEEAAAASQAATATEALRKAELNLERARLRLAQYGTEHEEREKEEANSIAQKQEKAQLNLEIARLKLAEHTAQHEERQEQEADSTAQQREKAQVNLEVARLQLSQAEEAARFASAQRQHDLVMARNSLEIAQIDLERAQAAYDTVKWRPDIGRLPQSRNLQLATLNYRKALATYEKDRIQSSPELSLAILRKKVELAELELEHLEVGQPTTPDYAVQLVQIGVELAELELAHLQAGQPTTPDYGLHLMQIDVELAELEVKRLKEAVQETTNFDVELKSLALEQQQLILSNQEEEMAKYAIVAPFSGVVRELYHSPGDKVEAYDEIVVLSDPSSLLIAANLTGVELAHIEPGQRAVIVFSEFPIQKMPGRVKALPSGLGIRGKPGAYDRTTKFEMLEPFAGMKLGMLANITVIVAERKDVLLINRAAVREGRYTTWVETLEAGHLKTTVVELGISSDIQVEVISGMKEGDLVVIR